MEPLEDRELDQVLRQWPAPEVPARLRATVFPPRDAPWWRRSIRVPLPVAAAAAVLIAAGVWRWVTPRERVVYRDSTAKVLSFEDLRPVTELRPRIIRRRHAQN